MRIPTLYKLLPTLSALLAASAAYAGDLKIEVGGMVTPVLLTQTQEAMVETFDEEPKELKEKK